MTSSAFPGRLADVAGPFQDPSALKKGGAMVARPERNVAAALVYARYGLPVFPCLPGSKVPATRHGFHDATTDTDQIERWWRGQPDANVAIATGLPGPDVLDVDQHGKAGNGFAAFERLKKAGLILRPSAIIRTPNGGLHVYFAGSKQPTRRLPGHHLDFRAAGGCVLVPPSQVNGKVYQLIRRFEGSPGRLDWAAAAELLEPKREPAVRAPAAGPSENGGLVAWVEGLGEGNRNSGLFWAACRAVEAGELDLLDDLAGAAARTGLPEREITRTIQSARQAAHLGRAGPARWIDRCGGQRQAEGERA